MPKLTTTLSATQNVEVKAKLNLKPQAVRMLLERAEESAMLNAEINERKERQDRLKKEVEEICKREKISNKLLEGFEIDGVPFKLVAGETTKWDVAKMVEDGIDPDDYRDKVPKKAYVKLGKSARKGEEED